MREGDRLDDLECPVCGRGRLMSEEEETEADSLPSNLDFQRLRFISARNARERERSRTETGSRRSARSRERIFALAREVGEDNYLVLDDGHIVKHVAELASCLDQLSPEVFRIHVNDLRNDFADWIENVFDEPALAARLREVEGSRRFQLEIYRYLTGRDPEDSE